MAQTLTDAEFYVESACTICVYQNDLIGENEGKRWVFCEFSASFLSKFLTSHTLHFNVLRRAGKHSFRSLSDAEFYGASFNTIYVYQNDVIGENEA